MSHPATIDSPTSATDRALRSFFAASALLDPIRLLIWDRDGLTVTQLRLLGHLYDHEGLSNAELADRLYVTRPSVSALLERLERGGFIRREVSPTDRRGICIWLEEPGRTAVSSLRAEIREYGVELMTGMTEAQREAMADSLQAFVESGRVHRRRDPDCAE
ncbi:MAG TPA: MarR family transcriptional regulator [Tepidiformaceae bacterium]|nr:MarR family transcriptional regulator [Tepidiformaceae bacterium]